MLLWLLCVEAASVNDCCGRCKFPRTCVACTHARESGPTSDDTVCVPTVRAKHAYVSGRTVVISARRLDQFPVAVKIWLMLICYWRKTLYYTSTCSVLRLVSAALPSPLRATDQRQGCRTERSVHATASTYALRSVFFQQAVAPRLPSSTHTRRPYTVTGHASSIFFFFLFCEDHPSSFDGIGHSDDNRPIVCLQIVYYALFDGCARLSLRPSKYLEIHFFFSQILIQRFWLYLISTTKYIYREEEYWHILH